MVSNSSSVSRRMAVRNVSSNCLNASRSGDALSRFRICNHCPAKFSTSAFAFGSWSIRFTSDARLRRSAPRSANANSRSSGMLLHRK
jgi:hypothetical protein